MFSRYLVSLGLWNFLFLVKEKSKEVGLCVYVGLKEKGMVLYYRD